MTESKQSHTSLTVIFIILLVLGGIFLLWPASEVFMILFAAVLFAVFITALASFIPKIPAIPIVAVRLGVIVLLFSALLVFFVTAGPRIGEQVEKLNEQLPLAFERLDDLTNGKPWNEWIGNFWLRKLRPDAAQLMAGARGIFSTAFGAAAQVLLIFFIGFYLALQPEIYLQGLMHLIPKKHREKASRLWEALNQALSWWMLGRFASMAAVGILTAIGLELMGMPLALVLGVIAGLLCFVPYVGPILSAVPAVLVGLLESPITALYVLLLYAGIQFVEGNFLTPVIQRRAVSLPPAVLLTAQLLMGVFYGLVGVFLATPMAVVVIVSVQVLYVHHVIQDPVPLLGEHGQE